MLNKNSKYYKDLHNILIGLVIFLLSFVFRLFYPLFLILYIAGIVFFSNGLVGLLKINNKIVRVITIVIVSIVVFTIVAFYGLSKVT